MTSFLCIFYSRPYKIEKKPEQIYVNLDHPFDNGNHHKVSQVIEPVVNTITDAIKRKFETSNRRTNVDSTENYYGLPLDYNYDIDDDIVLNYASSTPKYYKEEPPKYLREEFDRLQSLKRYYKNFNPRRNKFEAFKSEKSYYYPPSRPPIKYY